MIDRLKLMVRLTGFMIRGRLGLLPPLPAAAGRLAPEPRALLGKLAGAQGLLAAAQPLTEDKIRLARRFMAKAAAGETYPLADVTIEDRTIPVGDTAIPVRIYRPKADEPLSPVTNNEELPSPATEPGWRNDGSRPGSSPGTAELPPPSPATEPGRGSTEPYPLHVFFHGGAFLFGRHTDPETDSYLRRRCRDAGVVVVNVDYRLAPEHRFPTGVEDCYAAVTWVADNAASLDGDPSRLTVGGVSSGGNMAAAVSVMARDRGTPALLGQLLEIPGTNLKKDSPAWLDPDSLKDTTREADLALVGFYLSDPAQIGDPYASPVLAASLAGVAPAYVMSAEFDPRRDESEVYAARLTAAGSTSVARKMTGHIHGSYALWPTWEPARAWQDEANRALRDLNRTGRWPAGADQPGQE